MLCAEVTSSRVSPDMTVAFVTGFTPSFRSSFTQDDLFVVGRQSAFITIGRRRGGVPRTKSFTLDRYDAAGTGHSFGVQSLHSQGYSPTKGRPCLACSAGSKGIVDEIRGLRHI